MGFADAQPSYELANSVRLLEPTANARAPLCYSTERLAAFTTLAHFAVSSARNLPNSAGDIGIGMPPNSASFASIFGLARAAVTDLFKTSTTSAGVPFGAEMPYQGAAS